MESFWLICDHKGKVGICLSGRELTLHWNRNRKQNVCVQCTNTNWKRWNSIDLLYSFLDSYNLIKIVKSTRLESLKYHVSCVREFCLETQAVNRAIKQNSTKQMYVSKGWGTRSSNSLGHRCFLEWKFDNTCSVEYINRICQSTR